MDGPNLKKMNGIGNMAKLMKPSKLVAQSMPRRSYIWKVKRGNTVNGQQSHA